MQLLERLWRGLISLKLAVIVIVLITVSMIAGTFLESIYDTPTAVYYVYDALWFEALLGLLGLEILAVAISRWPWKRRHIPFLLAHFGIILILIGGFLTKYRGVDGTMTIQEGEISNAVELSDELLVVQDVYEGSYEVTEVPWLPPAAGFSPIDVDGLDVRVDDYITHAEAKYDFRPADGDAGAPAVKLRLEGGPMDFKEEFWLWAGEPAWSTLSMGPARFTLLPSRGDAADDLDSSGDAARLRLRPAKDGGLSYAAVSRSGRKAAGTIDPASGNERVIRTGWMGGGENGLRVRVLEWIPSARNATRYLPARVQYGQGVASPAIRLSIGGKDSAWLGLHDRIRFRLGEREYRAAFVPRRVLTPFALRLDRFQIDHYQGTNDPKEYSSKVSVLESDSAGTNPDGFASEGVLISMNEPLEKGGYTFYQASYIPGQPRPTISVFSVNQDPGRWLKYIGSILLVGGAISLFAVKLAARRRALAKGAPLKTNHNPRPGNEPGRSPETPVVQS